MARTGLRVVLVRGPHANQFNDRDGHADAAAALQQNVELNQKKKPKLKNAKTKERKKEKKKEK